jgi:hypothetical protein
VLPTDSWGPLNGQTQGPFPTPTPTPAPSANRTVVTLGSGASIRDANQNVWTLSSGGQVQRKKRESLPTFSSPVHSSYLFIFLKKRW